MHQEMVWRCGIMWCADHGWTADRSMVRQRLTSKPWWQTPMETSETGTERVVRCTRKAVRRSQCWRSSKEDKKNSELAKSNNNNPKTECGVVERPTAPIIGNTERCSIRLGHEKFSLRWSRTRRIVEGGDISETPCVSFALTLPAA